MASRVANKKTLLLLMMMQDEELPVSNERRINSRGGGGGTPIYGLYRYVPRDRVCFLRFSVLK